MICCLKWPQTKSRAGGNWREKKELEELMGNAAKEEEEVEQEVENAL